MKEGIVEKDSEQDKSTVDWIWYSALFAIILPCLFTFSLFLKYEGAWRMWLSLFFSRGIYFVLAALIFGCFIITFFKNKIKTSTEEEDTDQEQNWQIQNHQILKSTIFSSGGDLVHRKPFSVEDVCGSDTAKQLLREAEARNEALKRELEELNKSRLELEERSSALEREKTKIEEHLEETKFQSALESEGLRKEAAVAQRQLQQVLEEKEMLTREVSSVNRESRITESVLKDQARLTVRLEEARAELNRLKMQMEEMKIERDTAVAIAADLAVRAQGAADDSAQLIGQWVKREMENRRSKAGTPTIMEAVNADPEPVEEVVDAEYIIQEENEQNERVEEMLREVPLANEEIIPEPEEYPTQQGYLEEDEVPELHMEMNTESSAPPVQVNWEEEATDEAFQALGYGPVTSSEAFREFLTAHYSQMPL